MRPVQTSWQALGCDRMRLRSSDPDLDGMVIQT